MFSSSKSKAASQLGRGSYDFGGSAWHLSGHVQAMQVCLALLKAGTYSEETNAFEGVLGSLAIWKPTDDTHALAIRREVQHSQHFQLQRRALTINFHLAPTQGHSISIAYQQR